MASTETACSKIEKQLHAYRPVQIIHSGYPKTEDERAAYLDAAEQNGLGGFCINMDVFVPRLPNETDTAYRIRSLGVYLAEDTEEAEAAWTALAAFIDACYARGLAVWIYDERAYPSGAAGDGVLRRMPDAQVKGLFCQTIVTKHIVGNLPREKGLLRYAAAYPLDDDGRCIMARAQPLTITEDSISWKLPDGTVSWRIAAFYTRPAEFYTENCVPYVDLMRADVTDCFLSVTHEVYLRKLGADRIAKITAFFTDEPGLPTHGCSSYFYETNAVAAWTEEMDQLLPHMEPYYVCLFFDTDREDGAVRIQWWRTAAKLFSENYFGRIGRWCNAYGTRLTGHLYGEETLSMQIGLNADLFSLYRHMQMPGVDRLYCTDPRDVIAEKTASSAAHLYGRCGVMSENSFHLEYNFWHTPESATAENRLNSAFYQIQLGVTNITSYFPYQPSFSDDQLQFEEETARAAAFCQMGTHQTDVLVLIPMDAAYARFTPSDHKYWDVGPCKVAPHQPQRIQTLEKIYGDVLEILEDTHFDCDVIDCAGLCACSAADGKISTPFETFSVLVLLDSGTFDEPFIDYLRMYLEHGGQIAAVATDEPSAQIASLAADYSIGIHRCTADQLPQTLCMAGAAPVLSLSGDTAYIRVRKSVTAEGTALWFLHNRGAENAVITASLSGNLALLQTDGTQKKLHADGKICLELGAKHVLMIIQA